MTNENTKKSAVKILYDVYTLNVGINERIMKLFEEMQKEEKQEEEKKKEKKSKKSESEQNGQTGKDTEDLSSDEEKKLYDIMRALSTGKGMEKTEETIKKLEAEKKAQESEESEEPSHPSDSEEQVDSEGAEGGESTSGVSESTGGIQIGKLDEEKGEGDETDGEMVEIPYVDHTSTEAGAGSDKGSSDVKEEIKDKVYCGVCRKYHTKGTHD